MEQERINKLRNSRLMKVFNAEETCLKSLEVENEVSLRLNR